MLLLLLFQLLLVWMLLLFQLLLLQLQLVLLLLVLLLLLLQQLQLVLLQLVLLLQLLVLLLGLRVLLAQRVVNIRWIQVGNTSSTRRNGTKGGRRRGTFGEHHRRTRAGGGVHLGGCGRLCGEDGRLRSGMVRGEGHVAAAGRGPGPVFTGRCSSWVSRGLAVVLGTVGLYFLVGTNFRRVVLVRGGCGVVEAVCTGMGRREVVVYLATGLVGSAVVVVVVVLIGLLEGGKVPRVVVVVVVLVVVDVVELLLLLVPG